MEIRRLWLNRIFVEAFGSWVGISVESGFTQACPRPKARARHLVRIRFLRYPVGNVRKAARMLRRGSSGKPGHGQVECAPEEVYRADLTDEAGTEILKNAISLHEGVPETRDCLRIIARCCSSFSKGKLFPPGPARKDLDLDTQFRASTSRGLGEEVVTDMGWRGNECSAPSGVKIRSAWAIKSKWMVNERFRREWAKS